MPIILAAQEDLSSKPPWANSSDPVLKIPNTKNRAGGETQVVEHLPKQV
jgi:hypothetical protein